MALVTMKIVSNKHRNISDILSLSLLPLSGFATDIYLPSLPSMTISLHATMPQVQLSVIVFMISAGISQLFVGSLLDSFGRYRLSNTALFIFTIASFDIAWYPNLHVLYFMRGIQGITVAFIIVAKRAYFMDSYSGDRLKHFTSLFTIIWSAAPIIAPFLGGYLQKAFGWQSNFYFLGILTLIILVLTFRYGGESIKNFQPFKWKPMAQIYSSMLTTKGFIIALMILGLSFGMVMQFGMVSPFIIEHVWHYSPVVTGYCALLSGIALMAGGIVAKSTITKPLEKKIPVALKIQLASVILMITISGLFASAIYVMMLFVVLQHFVVGFVFNNLYAYSLGRFSRNAGIVSGLTGGGFYIISSFFSYGSVNLLHVKNQMLLGVAYLLLSLSVVLMYTLFRNNERYRVKQYNQNSQQIHS
jgi:MFS family permease